MAARGEEGLRLSALLTRVLAGELADDDFEAAVRADAAARGVEPIVSDLLILPGSPGSSEEV